MLPNGDMFVIPVKLVDMLSVDATHYLQGLFAADYPFFGHFSFVAEVSAGCFAEFMGDGLVGQHC